MKNKQITKIVAVQKSGSNTRVEIPSLFVAMFAIQKSDKFRWTWDSGTGEFKGKLQEKEEE